MFPALAIVLGAIRYNVIQDVMMSVLPAIINVVFLALQLALLTVYFSIKEGRAINITKNLIGWGDLLFLVAIAFYFSVLNYILFYVLSLVLTLIVWKIWTVRRASSKEVPLAGLQAMIFLIFAVCDWLSPQLKLTDDQWLYILFYRS